MGDRTGIEWTDATWNPLRGCSRVSDGCRHCYAETVAARFSGEGQPYAGLIHPTTRGWNGSVRLIWEALALPARWSKPRRIFVNSMSDLFHESVPFETIDMIFAVMAQNPRHTFQVLTKRAERMHRYLSTRDRLERIYAQWYATSGQPAEADAWPLPNVWVGVSVEDQRAADTRIPLLLTSPAAVRWISAEPLLGPVDLTDIDDGAAHREIPREFWSEGFDTDDSPPSMGLNALTGLRWQRFGEWEERGPRLDWVVVGGESGHEARPMHPAWCRDLRDQCAEHGVAFLFKQWGEWEPREEWSDLHLHTSPRKFERQTAIMLDGSECSHDVVPQDVGAHRLARVGKKAAGRLLDGVQHDGYPERT
jgi:protein gp37